MNKFNRILTQRPTKEQEHGSDTKRGSNVYKYNKINKVVEPAKIYIKTDLK